MTAPRPNVRRIRLDRHEQAMQEYETPAPAIGWSWLAAIVVSLALWGVLVYVLIKVWP